MNWIFSIYFLFSFARAQAAIPLEKVKLPEGFKIELLAQVPEARALAVSPNGNIFVGSKGKGQVSAILRDKKTLKVTEVVTLVKNQDTPGGVAFFEDDLYFSAVDKIYRLRRIESHLKDPPKPILVTNNLPKESHHGLRYIAFGPDRKLYVNVGVPCNICEPDANHGRLFRMDKDGANREVVAQGVRNSVGFDWHPTTHELWFTDNGRDELGDNTPGCELNRAPKIGMHFGYPYCHAANVIDPEFGKGKNCKDYTPPAQVLGPHVAPLGLRFYTGQMFPNVYKNQIFIAEHGSWNRTEKIGYRVTVVQLDAAGKAISYEPFAEGFLEGGQAWGRPADVAIDHDGALLISDDQQGAVYRVSYVGKK